MEKFSVLSWNVQGKTNPTGHTSYKKVLAELSKSDFDIIVLQEMSGAERKLKKFQAENPYNIFISKLNKNSWLNKNGFNHNVVLSKHPIINAQEIIFSDFSKKRLLENCLRTDIKIKDKTLRLYNCHLAVYKAGPAVRLKQLEFILSDSQNHDGPIIICGDLNPIMPKAGLKRNVIRLWHRQPKPEMRIKDELIIKDEWELLNETATKFGFKEALDLSLPTWSPFKSANWEIFKLKLDWFLIKNLGVNNVELGDYISDHRPIKTVCYIK